MTKIIGICVLTLAVSSLAAAHDGGACKKDAETYCASVTAGHGAKVKCLKENEAKLSGECKAHLAEAKETMKELAEACHADMENFCHDVKKGGGRVIKCMKEHKDQLSAACKEEIEKKKEARKKH